MAIMTKAQWNKLQASLPSEDRTSYEDYLSSQGLSGSTANLDAAAAANTKNATDTIAALQALGIGGAPTVDTRAALTKLTSGQTLTDAEKAALNISPVSQTQPSATTTDPLKNKTVQPSAPSGYHYTWIGGSTTGQWQLYKDTPTGGTAVSGATVPAAGGTTATGAPVDATTALQNAYASQLATSQAAADKAARQSAYDLLLQQFQQYGLGSLVEPLKDLIGQNVSPSEFAIRLQNTDAYKQRFAANHDRIAKGLQALTPAQYIALEDQYQNVMRNYGLPSSYYSKDSMGTQAGFNKFIANDVSAAELEDRIATAQQRLINADPNVMNALKQFYPSISQGDVLAYTLDPTNALQDIKRKVTAAEIGGAALNQGLMTSQASAEDLAKYGITKAQAQAGYQSIGSFLPTATNLADIYQAQGLGPYTQATAEQEIFGTANAAEAARKRKKLSELEQAAFSAKSGASQNALSRDRAMSPYMLGTPGAGQF